MAYAFKGNLHIVNSHRIFHLIHVDLNEMASRGCLTDKHSHIDDVWLCCMLTASERRLGECD